MNPGLVWKMLRKDLAIGPRSPVFLWAIALPFLLTLVLQVAFGSLFDVEPRLAIVDEGASEITAALRRAEGVTVTSLDDAEELKERVQASDFDAGLILPASFDTELAAGKQPDLQFFVGGESHASDRIILTVTTLDAVTEVAGLGDSKVQVDVVDVGDEGLPISVRLVPIVVFYALAIAGIFVPSSSIVEEKEQGTLMALLVTPLKSVDVLAAKWLLGVGFASALGLVSLILNRALGSNWAHVLIVVVVAAALAATIGLLIGVIAKDSTVMFGIVKGLGIFLFAPTLFYLFPEWPQWIAKLFPFYWILEPIWRVSIMGENIAAVWTELLVAVGIIVALLGVCVVLARWLRGQMAAS